VAHNPTKRKKILIIFIHHENGRKQQKYIIYNENTIFKHKRKKTGNLKGEP